MERKFRFSLFGKELKRFWWLGVALLAIALVVIAVYSFGMYTITYTVEAGEFIYVEFSPTITDKMNYSFDEELTKINRLINGQSMKDYLNKLIVGCDPSIEKPEKQYSLVFKNNTCFIEVTMTKKEDSEKIAEAYLTRVKDEIENENKKYESEGVKVFHSNTFQSPLLLSEVGITPLKISIFGIGGAVALYIIIVICIYYFNRKLYDGLEFQDNFNAIVLESDVKKNGYANTAIKLTVQSREQDKPYVVALAGNIDTDAFAAKLMEEGFSVLKTDIVSALSSNRELREEGGFDVLSGTDGILKCAEDCKKDLKEKYQYDYILISATNGGAEKKYITAASIADGLILGFELKKEDFKQISCVFNELSVVQNMNLLGVVL